MRPLRRAAIRGKIIAILKRLYKALGLWQLCEWLGRLFYELVDLFF